MKKVILLSILTVVIFGSAFAKFVDMQTAQKIAATYYKFNSNDATVTASLAYTRTESDNTVDFYVFNINSKGFVIVSADDNAEPILAYSTETTFNSNVPNTGIQDWMDNVAARVNYIVKNNLQADKEIAYNWTAYSNGQNPVDTRVSSINPLLGSLTWNQSPYYNQDCPGGSVTGCVATAMAQIMKFWNYPAKGTGSYTYNAAPYGNLTADFGNTSYQWSAMPMALTSLSTTPQVNDVATLMSQAGISVAMEYSPSGSGAWVLQDDNPGGPCAQNSYVEYFGYNGNTIAGLYMSNYSSSQWSTVLKGELNAGRPIEYAGWGSVGGHTWVCDGYSASGLFHMNWGWGGADNGYYKTGSLNPGGDTFNSGDEALIGIEPARLREPVLSPRRGGATNTSNNLSSNNTNTVQSNGITSFNAEDITVYPIPASSGITIRYNGSKFSTANVSVVNMLGQTLTSYTAVNLNNNYQVDISKYAAGVYFLAVSTTDASDRKIIKFVKQ